MLVDACHYVISDINIFEIMKKGRVKREKAASEIALTKQAYASFVRFMPRIRSESQ
jgi:hypothetical protein